eukprot:TRINITY_DN13487_c0_g1_i1.p1 TRINITY_DN13487_c0_g1~~TRINITY_DN13487_c0_g1_i1.p1  ORF type:complete len:120 (+),score=23.76 TRINITY_DN13487_c0_g1_i1:258-617(+)
MLLEQLISSVLKQYRVQDYVLGLDPDNLKVSVTTGKVKLTNLEVNADALKSINLPVKIVKGTLGSLTIDLPWRKLNTDPTIIRISKVFILLGPKDVSEYKASDALKRELATKRGRLQLH